MTPLVHSQHISQNDVQSLISHEIQSFSNTILSPLIHQLSAQITRVREEHSPTVSTANQVLERMAETIVAPKQEQVQIINAIKADRQSVNYRAAQVHQLYSQKMQ